VAASESISQTVEVIDMGHFSALKWFMGKKKMSIIIYLVVLT